jgi:hypothetical protein
MNDFDRILDNQATIMRVLMEVVSSLPNGDKEHRVAILGLLESASSEAYEYAHRKDGGSIRP